MSELVITHETRPSPAMQFLVNFGVFAGREATRLETERLAKRLLRTLPTVTVCAERRLEASGHSLAELHQVRVEIDRELPDGEEDVESLRLQLAAEIEQWAADCLTGIGGELTEVEIAARDAVVDVTSEGDG
jgi:hypothetical protein